MFPATQYQLLTTVKVRQNSLRYIINNNEDDPFVPLRFLSTLDLGLNPG